MTQQVLILGGTGRIGSSVAADLIEHTPVTLQLAGRSESRGEQLDTRFGGRAQFLSLDLADQEGLDRAIAGVDLVIHCAGPFHFRDGRVLKSCIQQGVNYLDVSDHPSFTRKALALRDAATRAGITAIVNTGIFPGISNSMVRRDVERLDKVERIHLSYVVGSSGGAGLTVMRTTFLGLQRPFQAWLEGQWQQVKPYSQRETITFPPPYGRTGVYWFDMPETFTLPETFSVQNVVTKFGSAPDFYNHLTWWVSHGWHPKLLRTPAVIEFLSRVSFGMTKVTDRLSGIGVAIRSEVTGFKNGEPAQSCSTLVHDNTAIAAGKGTGSLAELLLSGQLHKPGVWVVEQALPTELFEQTLRSRNLQIQQCQTEEEHQPSPTLLPS